MKKIVYLYRELMAYNIPVLKELVKEGCHVIFVHKDSGRKTPIDEIVIKGVDFVKKSHMSDSTLKYEVKKIKPDLIFISDRTVPIYNYIGREHRKKIPVISGCDTQWRGGKQWLNVITSFLRHKTYFSHMMVAGIRQFEYAKRLGFSNSKIIWPLYSADTAKFTDIPITEDRFESSKDILFVGRLNKVKGVIFLLEAWSRISNENKAKLHIVGNGDLLLDVNLPANVIVHDFLNQEELKALSKKVRAFVLPSIYEPWGVVIHEFAAAGLPLITTNVCGASMHFVINNYNGFVIEPASIEQIEESILKIFRLDAKTLAKMGNRSRCLSKSISPEIVSSALLSCLEKS